MDGNWSCGGFCEVVSAKVMAQRRQRCDAMQTLSGRLSASDRIIPYGNTPSFAYLQNKTAFGASK